MLTPQMYFSCFRDSTCGSTLASIWWSREKRLTVGGKHGLTQMPREWLNSCRIFISNKIKFSFSLSSCSVLISNFILYARMNTHTRTHFCCSFFSRHVLWKRKCGNGTIDVFSYDDVNVRPKEVKIHFAPMHLRSPSLTFKTSVKMTTKNISISGWFAMLFLVAETKSVELNELNPIFWHFSYRKDYSVCRCLRWFWVLVKKKNCRIRIHMYVA